MDKNELENWAETHYCVVAEIERVQEESEKIQQIINTEGQGGVWELAFEITQEFEAINKDTDWEKFEEKGVSWYEILDDFITKKLF